MKEENLFCHWEESGRGKLVRDAIHRFMHVDRLHRQAFDGVLGNLGIHRSQHRILVYIKKNGPVCSQKEIARHFDVSAAAVASAMRRLEAEGYLTRCVPDEDTRRREVHITPAGEAVLEKTWQIFSSVDEAMFCDFSDEELRSLTAELDRVQTSLVAFLHERMDGCGENPEKDPGEEKA